MSRGAKGRSAALPPVGYQPPKRRGGAGDLTVRFDSENPDEPPLDFDFSAWEVSVALKESFAAAFAERTRPGGKVRTVASAKKTWYNLRRFSEYLADLTSPPATVADLTPAHVGGWYLPKRKNAGGAMELGELKATLRKLDGLHDEFLSSLSEQNPPRIKTPGMGSYSRSENQRILSAARSDVRRAAQQIRLHRDLLAQWRAGDVASEAPEVQRMGELLDYIDTHDDVPRYPNGNQLPQRWVAEIGTVEDHMARLHLSAADIAAFAVLLVGLTGQNSGTILRAPARHHRADGYAGDVPSAIVKLDKPRRGPRRHMDVPLTAVPPWAEHGKPTEGNAHTDPERLDLQSPFGVYQLLHELAEPARAKLGSDRLFVWWANRGGMGVGRGFRAQVHSDLIRTWAWQRAIPADEASQEIEVTLARMRLTFNELQQRPVAHTDKTLANEYLARNRGNLTEYQQVVAKALTEQVAKATTHAKLDTLSADEIDEARTDPRAVAARHGLDADTLQRLLAGELDTVLGACVDHTNSPHADSGQPCRESFMLCLSCPCARATPAHLPIQVLVHDELLARKAAVTPMRWAQRFALPHAQLADLLDRAGETAVADARATATATQHQLAQRFLARELDLT